MNISINGVAPAGPGHNNPPEPIKEPTPFELSKAEIDLLYMEACNWADGEPIKTELQATEVDRLIERMREARDLADERRITENEPFDKGKAAVQEKYAELIADTKSKKGNAVLAIAALKKVVEPYRKRIADEKAAVAEKLRLEAEAKRREAEEAFRASKVDNLAEREKAEALLAEAKKAEKASGKAEKAATTGLGLRTVYSAEIADRNVFAKFVWTNHPDDMNRFLADLASDLVRRGLRTIPGVNIHENKVAL